MQDIKAKLDELAEVRAAVDLTRADFESKRAEILKAVQAELEALDAEFKPMLETSEQRIAALELEIKEAVLQRGASVKGSRIYAVYYRGRVTWDRDGLERYAAAHPEIVEFRREGAPSVSLRFVEQ